MTRVELQVDEALDRHYPAAWSARVEVDLSGGGRRAAEVAAPKGDPENPLTDEELVAKFRDLVDGTRYAPLVDQVIDSVQEISGRATMRGFLPPTD